LEARGEATTRTTKNLALRNGTRRLEAATARVRKAVAAIAAEGCMEQVERRRVNGS
jgi:hypothetical protein